MSLTAPNPAPEPVATPARKRRKWPWIVGGAVVLIGVLATATHPNGTAATGLAANRSGAAPAPTASHAPTGPTVTTIPAAPSKVTAAVPKATPAPVSAAPVTPAPVSAAPAAPAAPPAPVVLYRKSGTGTASTPDFTTGGEWQISYSYDCTAFGGQGNFIVTSADDYQVTINELGANGSDIDYVHDDPGTHALSINSECAWTIKVLG